MLNTPWNRQKGTTTLWRETSEEREERQLDGRAPPEPALARREPRWQYPVVQSRPTSLRKVPSRRWAARVQRRAPAPVAGPTAYQPSIAVLASTAPPTRQWPRHSAVPRLGQWPMPLAGDRPPPPAAPREDDPSNGPGDPDPIQRDSPLPGWNPVPLNQPCREIPTRGEYIAARCCRRDECTNTFDRFIGLRPDGRHTFVSMTYPFRAPAWRGLRVNDCAGQCDDPYASLERTPDDAVGGLASPNRFPDQATACEACDIPPLRTANALRAFRQAVQAVRSDWNTLTIDARPTTAGTRSQRETDRAQLRTDTALLVQRGLAMLIANQDLVRAAMCITRSSTGSDAGTYTASWVRRENLVLATIRLWRSWLKIRWSNGRTPAGLHRDIVTGATASSFPAPTFLYINNQLPYLRTLAVVTRATASPPADRVDVAKAMGVYLLLGLEHAHGMIPSPIYPHRSGRCRAAIRAINTLWWLLDRRYAPGRCAAAAPGSLNDLCLFNSDYLHARPATCSTDSGCATDRRVVTCPTSHWAGRLGPPDPQFRIEARRSEAGLDPDGGCCWPPMVSPRSDPFSDYETPGFEYTIPDCDRRPG